MLRFRPTLRGRVLTPMMTRLRGVGWRVAACVLAGVAALGCSAADPAGSSDGAPDAHASPAAATATVPPSASQSSPSVAFAFTGADPVVARAMTGLDHLYINPGAILEDDGRLHMFANLFSAWPGHVDVVHFVSADGKAWDLAQPDPVLTSDDIPLTNSGADVSTGFVADDGTWVLIFETVEATRPWILGRATAPGPDGPWTVDDSPILEPGASGSWDAGGLSWPSVTRTRDGYALYYTGVDRPRGRGSIGLARSTDGVSWTKHDGPVLEAEAAWERGGLDRPRVVATPRGSALVYAGSRLTDRGLAWSDDGTTWRRDGDVPVITSAALPVADRAWDAALINREGTLYYYLEIGAASGSAGTEVYLATGTIP
jgi:predicted GH43/DUF377 family glycosyl hydrolase